MVGGDLFFEHPALAAAAMATGAGESCGPVGAVMTRATAPSVSWQQSNRRMHGSAIQRDAWWSSSVIGLPKKWALGFVAA